MFSWWTQFPDVDETAYSRGSSLRHHHCAERVDHPADLAILSVQKNLQIEQQVRYWLGSIVACDFGAIFSSMLCDFGFNITVFLIWANPNHFFVSNRPFLNVMTNIVQSLTIKA